MQKRVIDYGPIQVGKYALSHLTPDGAESFSVVSHVRHPGFNGQVCCGYYSGTYFDGVVNDFLILKLSGESMKPVIRLNADPSIPRENATLYVIGFGDTNPGPAYQVPKYLHEVTVNYESNDKCSRTSVYPSNLLSNSSMCATDPGEDACNGDSGGPLLVKGNTHATDVQVGLVSW